MSDARVFPYFFPTTVVFVDDSTSFLESLALQLPEDLAYQTYESPDAALERVNARPPTPPLYQRCFSQYHSSGLEGNSERLIHLDLSLIEREISNAERFREISVVVVDYDMPGMDGLEFCKRITNPRIKKVLFTGVADEKVAVQAFNAGIIDRFIIKKHGDAVSDVNATVRELQCRYFEDISEMLRGSLMLDAPPFLTDPAFEAFFAELRGRHRFVEYYLVADPGGFLLLDDEGRLYRLVVMSGPELDRKAEFARLHGAPAEVVSALTDRRAVSYFYETIDTFFDAADYAWSDYLFPAERLAGQELWFWALLPDPPVDIDYDEECSNYRAYLERLDAEAAA